MGEDAGEDRQRRDRDGQRAGDEARAPLSDLREDVERRREEADAAAADDAAELFREMDVGDVDEESVWSELSAAAQTPSVGPGEAVPDEGTGDAAATGTGDDRSVTVVEKRLCHGCPHFADPPETACTHEGTSIDAEVDTDHFRVVDCPVVAARDRREASDFSPDDG
ncbi:hypothetical protein [Halobacterium yunchengense]|uniref:hypothetical protein n=1 Tax=Halobacterium yunchengense TaxID=3108497 RepID=UPI003009FED5